MERSQTGSLIELNEFCLIHDIEISFVGSLQQIGLIEIKTIEDKDFISVDQLKQAEKLIRLYYELDINIEGIETIIHLLRRIVELQDEIIMLKNRLRIYETKE